MMKLLRRAKKIRLWRRLKDVGIARRRLSDAVELDRAEIYDPLYAAKRDALARRD